jgi:cbb3-type cytochrome oxidase maturation protein
MSVVTILLPLALLLGLGFLGGYVWAVRHDQFEDGDTPALRMLIDDNQPD